MSDPEKIVSAEHIVAEPISSDKLSGDESAGQSNENIGKAAPISTTGMIREQAQRATPERSWEEIYEVRLRRFWSAAHASAEIPDAMDDEWEVFKEAMVRLGALATLVDGDTLPSEEIPGSLGDVQLIVARRMEQGLAPNEVVNFIRTSLAPTIDRLEQRQEGTPERRTDIIVRAIQPLEGTAEAANLGCELMRYMQSQRPEQRLAGYYDTIDDIGSIVRAGADEYRPSGVFISHVVLNGMRTLVTDAPTEFNRGELSIVSNSAFRLAVMLSGIFSEHQEQPNERALLALRDLQMISAATTPLLPIDHANGMELARILGFQTRHPTDFFTALEDMGSVGPAWQRSRIGQSRLTALSGVTAAVADKKMNAVSRIFNAGIALAIEDINRSSSSETLRRGELLINAIGLRMALLFGENLFTALTQFPGLSCGVNLLGAFVRYWRMPDAIAKVKEELLPLVQDILNLTNWPALQGLGNRMDPTLARFAAASGALKRPPEAQPRFDHFAHHIEQALDSLRVTINLSKSLDNPLLDASQLIGELFTSVLVSDEDEDLERLVEGITESRKNPDRVFIERYAVYASSPGDQVGRGPFVAAGVMTSEEWDELANQLLEPRSAIAPMLRKF